jgi:probable FeS assembly SUF system protein SufT
MKIKPGDDIQLKRDCLAVRIPSGEPVELSEGQNVSVTQALGGSFTVMTHIGMVRIESKDADALGAEVPKDEPIPETEEDLEKAVWKQLKEVYDPEIPVNIVDLGLVYSMDLLQEDGKTRVDVKMTLTAPGCGMGPVIQQDAQGRVLNIPGIDDCAVDLVWDPPWNQDMISEAGKMKLGMI